MATISQIYKPIKLIMNIDDPQFFSVSNRYISITFTGVLSDTRCMQSKTCLNCNYDNGEKINDQMAINMCNDIGNAKCLFYAKLYNNSHNINEQWFILNTNDKLGKTVKLFEYMTIELQLLNNLPNKYSGIKKNYVAIVKTQVLDDNQQFGIYKNNKRN